MRKTLGKTPWEVFYHTNIDEKEAEKDDPEHDDFLAWREYELEVRAFRSLNTWASVAAVWIKINGKGLYEMEGLMPDERDWDSNELERSEGVVEREIHNWRERVEWISKVTALDRSTKETAREAADLMKEIENR